MTVARKKFSWTYKDVDLALHPVGGLVLQVGDAGKFPRALGFENLDPSFRVSKRDPRVTAEEDEGDKRLVQLKLACKADGAASSDPV